MCIREFSRCLNEHNRVYSVMLGANRWSAMRIESVVAGFVGILTFSMFFLHQSKFIDFYLFERIHFFKGMPISDLSLVLAYSFTLMGSVQWIVRLTVDVTMQV